MRPDPILLPEALGDPEVMRVLARGWVARATQLDELSAVIGSTTSDLGLEGPGAGAIVEQCDAARQSASAGASELHALASQLLAAAGEVEELIARAKAEAAAEADRFDAETVAGVKGGGGAEPGGFDAETGAGPKPTHEAAAAPADPEGDTYGATAEPAVDRYSATAEPQGDRYGSVAEAGGPGVKEGTEGRPAAAAPPPPSAPPGGRG